MHNSDQTLIVSITSSARKHLLIRARISQALANQTAAVTLDAAGTDPKILFVGVDDRGAELEIVAVVLPARLLVIHAMPTHYRKARP